VSPGFTIKTWTHRGLTVDSPWTHPEEGMAKVPAWSCPCPSDVGCQTNGS